MVALIFRNWTVGGRKPTQPKWDGRWETAWNMATILGGTRSEAEALYGLLESEVIPEFYTRDESCIPTAWITRMRESMAQLTPRFSTNRSEREYTERYYLPAAAAYRSRAANNGAFGKRVVDWRLRIEQNWDALRFGEIECETNDISHIFEMEVYLGDLDPQTVEIELYADGRGGDAALRQKMDRIRQVPGVTGSYVYSAAVSAIRPAQDYTARVMPYTDGVATPLEETKIKWQR